MPPEPVSPASGADRPEHGSDLAVDDAVPEADVDDTEPDADPAVDDAAEQHPRHHRHPHLIDPEEDRWKWRAKIRRNPHQLFFYRIGVVVAGLALMALAIITGPLPGPGGIPVFLLGLAVLASEFEWAHRVMLWFKRQLHRYLQWPRRKKALFWIVFLGVCGLAWYASMLFAGVPEWMPETVTNYLTMLPGVD